MVEIALFDSAGLRDGDLSLVEHESIEIGHEVREQRIARALGQIPNQPRLQLTIAVLLGGNSDTAPGGNGSAVVTGEERAQRRRRERLIWSAVAAPARSR